VRYNRSILDAERSARRFTRSGGEGIVLRFAAFYGPDAFQVHDMIRLVRKGWAPLPGAADAYISSVSHDDAALTLPAGTYNVVDDEPLVRSVYFGLLAQELGVPPPRPQPAWMTRLFGSLGELLARSQRISNRRLRQATGWAPAYPSMRQGWRAALNAQEMRKMT
jgi:nucleoside-diphosphate-sugar epimerase